MGESERVQDQAVARPSKVGRGDKMSNDGDAYQRTSTDVGELFPQVMAGEAAGQATSIVAWGSSRSPDRLQP
jgi:hypothetical protein